MAQVNLEAVVKLKDEASAGLKTLGGSFKEAGQTADKILAAGAVAATAAVGALSAVAFRAVGEFRAQADAEDRLRASILNVKNATDKNVDSLFQQANALQQVTRFSDEQIISGQAVLANYQLNQKQIETLTPSLLNLAEKMRGVDGGTVSLEQAATIFGKAVSGNVTFLQRYTGELDANYLKTLDSMSANERSAAILKLMDERFKNLATSAGKGLSGQLDILNHNISEFFEVVGRGIAQRLQPMIETLNANKDAFADFGTKAGVAIGSLIDALIRAATVAIAFGKEVKQWVQDNPKTVDIIQKIVAGLAAFIAVSIVIIKIVGFFTALFAALSSSFVLVTLAIAAFGGQLYLMYLQLKYSWEQAVYWWGVIKDVFGKAKDYVKAQLDFIGGYLANLPYWFGYFLGWVAMQLWDFATKTLPAWNDAVSGWFAALPGRVGAALGNLWDKTKSGFIGFYNSLKDWAKQTIDDVVQLFRDLPGLIGQALKSIGSAFTNAQSSFNSGIASAATQFARGFARALHIPGFATGGVVPGQPGQPTLAVVHGGERVIPYGAPDNSGGGITININGEVNMRSEADIRQLAILLGQQIGLASRGAY